MLIAEQTIVSIDADRRLTLDQHLLGTGLRRVYEHATYFCVLGFCVDIGQHCRRRVFPSSVMGMDTRWPGRCRRPVGFLPGQALGAAKLSGTRALSLFL